MPRKVMLLKKSTITMLNVPFLDRWPHIVNLYCRKTVAEPTEGLIPTSEELIEVDDGPRLRDSLQFIPIAVEKVLSKKLSLW